MHTGGIILCGGQSVRMGVPKATLPFGDELMLQRVVRLLSEAVQPIVVVSAHLQALPPLPGDVRIIRDERPGRGPLEGLRAGLAAIRQQAQAAYATSCDVPLLAPAFVRRMVELAEEDDDYDIIVPKDGQFHYPLAAVYRTSVLAQIEKLLAADRLRLTNLFDCCRTREVPVEQLRSVDADLRTLENINHPEEYHAALARAGFAARSR